MTPADAVVAAVTAAVPGVEVFDSIVVDRPAGSRWVSVFPDRGTFEQIDLKHATDVATVRWLVNTFGPDRKTSEWLANKVRDYLLTRFITVPGWSDAAVLHDVSVEARDDTDVGEAPLVVCSDRYSMTVTREYAA